MLEVLRKLLDYLVPSFLKHPVRIAANGKHSSDAEIDGRRRIERDMIVAGEHIAVESSVGRMQERRGKTTMGVVRSNRLRGQIKNSTNSSPASRVDGSHTCQRLSWFHQQWHRSLACGSCRVTKYWEASLSSNTLTAP